MQYEYRTVSVLKDSARGRLMGNYGRAIGITLSQLLFPYFANFIGAELEYSLRGMLTRSGKTLSLTADLLVAGGGYLLTSFLLIIASVCMAGVALFYLNLMTGHRPQISDFYYGFQTRFGDFLAISAALEVPSLVATLPYYICFYMVQSMGSTFDTWILVALFALGLLVRVIMALLIGPAFYLALDFPELTPAQVLKRTFLKMHGNRLRLLKLMLSFLPMIVLGACSFGIGLLWVEVYYRTALTGFYLDLMNPKVISGSFDRTV